MCPREIRILNSLDRKIDESCGQMGLGEMRAYRRLLIRFVEDASRVERRPGTGMGQSLLFCGRRPSRHVLSQRPKA